MTDKERIEVYVNKLPAQCLDCRFAYYGRCQAHENGEYYCVENCRRSDCPLKTIQSVQNQKAVEALAEAERRLYESYYHDEGEGKYSVYMEEVQSVIAQLIKEYGGKDERKLD